MAPAIPIVEPDAFIETTIKGLLERSEQRQKLFRLKKESLSEIKDFVAHEAASSCSVHAEIQLLFYHEKHPPKIPPRIICSSKKACFLCNLFIKCERFISEGASPILILAIPPTTASVDQLLLRIKRLLFPLYRKRVHIPHTTYTRDIHKPDIFY
jgi:hypothetical protein